MNKFKIGIMSDRYRVGLKEGIKKAALAGGDGVQLYALRTDRLSGPVRDLHDELFNERKEVFGLVRDLGLEVSALCCEVGGFVKDPEHNREKIEKTKRIIELAEDYETNVVTAHIGVVSEDSDRKEYKMLLDVMGEIGEFAAKRDVVFAIETGQERTVTLRKFLDDLGSKGVGVNYDPANLVMVTGDDPIQGVITLKDYIVHTHAKDGIMLKKSYPERIFGNVPDDYVDDGKPSYIEVPLGEGKVDFPRWLEVLKDVGYNGFLTIEREVGETPEKDINEAIGFLKNIIVGMEGQA